MSTTEALWTVRVTGCGTTSWSDWVSWVDRATAEADAREAQTEGYQTKIVPAEGVT